MGKKQILLCYVRLDQIENVQWDYAGDGNAERNV